MDNLMKISRCLFFAYDNLSDVNATARIAADNKQHGLTKNWQKLARIGQIIKFQFTLLRDMTEAYADLRKLPRNTG